MPIDPSKVHTYSIRRPKSELQRLRELARILNKTPSGLINDAFNAMLPKLQKEAGLPVAAK